MNLNTKTRVLIEEQTIALKMYIKLNNLYQQFII